jgi:transcriptional regulator with GAF, ATPase, and Fis domain
MHSSRTGSDQRRLDTQGADGAARTIVVHDPRGDGGPRLHEPLAECRLTRRSVADRSTLAQLRPDEDCGIALVAVSEDPDPASALLDAVGLLKRNGYTVVCYWNGAETWALGTQCRLLLAGASHLLDGTDSAFGDELRRRLVQLIDAEAERQREDRRIEEQMFGLGVVGRGPGITSVFRWVLRVSPLSDLAVLIVGETGTGKELVARAIHGLDPRRHDRPFVPVNCGAISSGVAESELFGHRRGAFTGAGHDRTGLVRAARGGVLFLDEIGDLDLNLQGKLLRVLQERRVLPLGEDREVAVDVRIIAATNRDLEDMVRTRSFRTDLFHRLNVLSVRIPALRERPEDVEALVQHFIAGGADAAGERAAPPSREFVQALRGVDLQGNVRELENVVRRALVAHKGDGPLGLSDLPRALLSQLAQPAGREGAAGSSDPPAASSRGAEGAGPPRAEAPLLDAVAVLEASSWKLARALDLCEQQIVVAALGASSGNRSHAARLLGVSPRSMFNKVRKYRLAL